MVSLESLQAASIPMESSNSSPRISFSAEFLDENNFISITPNPLHKEREKACRNIGPEFEFLNPCSNVCSHATMLTADELFFEGKLLPFRQMQNAEKLSKISLSVRDKEDEVRNQVNKDQKSRVTSCFVDDDPSPRPPKCTVLWKELLRLKKQRATSSLSPSSSSSSSSSSSGSLADIVIADHHNNESKEKQQMKRAKKGLERTRSGSIRIRPMVNVPICTQMKSGTTLPPLFPLKKGKLEIR